MQLDPSIILGGKPVEPGNPLTMATQAMNLKDLAMKSQMNQFQMQQAMAQRQAAANAITTDQNGNPQFDSQKYLSSVAQTNPAGFQQAQQDQTQMSLEQHKQHVDQRMDAQSDFLSGDQSDGSYQKMLSTLNKQGLDTSMYPATNPGAGLIYSAQQKLQPVKDQIDQQQKQQGLGIQQQEASNKSQELALSLKKNDSENVQQTLAALQSARGNPAVQRAEQDIYSDAKVNSLVGKGDPDKLDMTRVRLLAGEVGKMATGGAPTLDELKGLTPGAVPQEFAQVAQKFLNEPTKANAGDFVKNLQGYSNSMANDAKDLLKQNYQGIIETKKPYLPKGSYDTLNQQFMGRLNGTVKPGDWTSNAASTATDGATKQWGNANWKVVNGNWVKQ